MPPFHRHAGRERIKSKPSTLTGNTGNRHAIAGKFAGLERETTQ
jgi:hypothetical protein